MLSKHAGLCYTERQGTDNTPLNDFSAVMSANVAFLDFRGDFLLYQGVPGILRLRRRQTPSGVQ